MKDMLQAKKIFDQYDGSHFQMFREGIYEEYKAYMIPREVEIRWIQEKQKKLLNLMYKCTNNKNTAEIFEKYCHYVMLLNDSSALECMFNYINGHKKDWDTNTLYRIILAFFSAIKIEKKQNLKEMMIRRCIDMLKEEVQNGVNISGDYKENGKFPDYLSEKILYDKIQRTMEYWTVYLV